MNENPHPGWVAGAWCLLWLLVAELKEECNPRLVSRSASCYQLSFPHKLPDKKSPFKKQQET